MAIGINPSSGTLAGTLTVNAVAGVATFANLSINAAGSGYTLGASAPGLTGSTSSAFNVTAGTASKLALHGAADERGGSCGDHAGGDGDHRGRFGEPGHHGAPAR